MQACLIYYIKRNLPVYLNLAHKLEIKITTTSFRWKNTRFLRTMNKSYIFKWVLCHIGFSHPLFLQTWCSVIRTGCICQESAIQLSSWKSFPKYRREGKYRREKIDESNKAQKLYFGDQDNRFRVLNEIEGWRGSRTFFWLWSTIMALSLQMIHFSEPLYLTLVQ